jgi:hypothetical protein
MVTFNAHQRKVVASVALGCWLFAFFVGVVYACGLDEGLGYSQQVVTASSENQVGGDEDALPGCERFCAEKPVLAKLQAVQDQPEGQTLLFARFSGGSLLPPFASTPSTVHRLYPPPGIALNTRFVRLAL